MNQHLSDKPQQIPSFASKQTPRDAGNPTDEAGQALVAMLQGAARLSKENYERTIAVAHKLSVQLRAAEDRIAELEADVELSRNRATGAERWLQAIQKEIEEKLITPMTVMRREQ